MTAAGFKFEDKGSVTITGYEGSDKAVSIPDTINGHKVKAIGDNAFENCTGIESVSMASTIETIGNYAFNGCTELSVINLSTSLTKIGSRFLNGTKVKSLYIPAGVTDSDVALCGANSLESVEFAEGMKTIPDETCSESTVSTVKLPSSLTSIGNYAFFKAENIDDVYYNATKEQRDAITVGSGNQTLIAATWHYLPSADASGDVAYPALGESVSYGGKTFTRSAANVLTCKDANGNAFKNDFATDGRYTYYFQEDGTAMQNRLTYHPNGINVIYFDSYGHEVFSNFHAVKANVEGNPVDDYCFFNVNGYMYVNTVTFDQAGQNLYYANPYGVLERHGWFAFSPDANYGDSGAKWSFTGSYMGYANADGTLMRNTTTYDASGRQVFIQANGEAIYW